MSNTTPIEALRRIDECRKNKSPKLDLTFLELAEIPSELADLVWLVDLNLSDNRITEIKNLENLTALITLYLADNQISEIKNLDKLTALTNLYLFGNQINEIKNLDKLTALMELNLGSTQIREIKNLDKLTALTTLYLHGTQISEVKNLDKLTALTTLFLVGTQISEIKNLDKLTALAILAISSSQITEIENLDKLLAMRTLSLSGNRITEIKNLENLTALTTLYLADNQISEIKNLDKLTALTNLYLFGNQINEIKNLDKLTALMELYLSDNQISEIKNLDKLTALTNLYLYRNQINSLTGLSSDLLAKLKEVDLSDNPIIGTTITDWKSSKAILGYLQSQKEDIQVTNYHLKVNIIGEGRIGKTQLFNFLDGKPYRPNEAPTHGTLTTQYDLPDSKYRATIWDFGGQSYHHGFHHVFLRPNDFYLVLWRNDPAKKPDYGYWLGTARNFSRPSKKEYLAPVVLVQNVWTETDDPEKKEAHQADAPAFPDSQKMQKYGIAVDDIFVIDINNLHKASPHWKTRHDYFEHSLHQKMIAHAQNLLPKISEKWLAVKEQLDREPIEKINLNKAEFKEQYAALFDEAALAGVLDYLEFTGNIIKFPEPSLLADYVFPNPPALSDWIYNTVLDKKLTSKSQGILKYRDLKKKIGKEAAMIFRKIMDEFNLLFTEKNHEDHLVIPQFLPENNNTFKRLLLELIPYSFCLRFADYFHESRIFQFISEYGEYADDNASYWRYGLVFTINEVNALVYYNHEERTVFVHLENKKGRTRIAQNIFDYFVFKQKVSLYTEKRLSYFAMRYNVGTSTLADVVTNKGIEIKTDPNALVSFEAHNALAQEYRWDNWRKELRDVAYGVVKENTRLEKLNSNDVIEGAQISTNQKTYIDIKETLFCNTEDFPVGINLEDRNPIKLVMFI